MLKNLNKSSKVSDTLTTRKVNNFTELESYAIISYIYHRLKETPIIYLGADINSIQYNCVVFESPYLKLHIDMLGYEEIRLYDFFGKRYEVITVNSFIVPLRRIFDAV